MFRSAKLPKFYTIILIIWDNIIIKNICATIISFPISASVAANIKESVKHVLKIHSHNMENIQKQRTNIICGMTLNILSISARSQGKIRSLKNRDHTQAGKQKEERTSLKLRVLQEKMKQVTHILGMLTILATFWGQLSKLSLSAWVWISPPRALQIAMKGGINVHLSPLFFPF